MSEQVLSEVKYGLVGNHSKARGMLNVLRGLPLSNEVGSEVREDFANFRPRTQAQIGEFASARVHSISWQKNPVYRDATLLLLRELSSMDQNPAPELGFQFAHAMGKINDPWIRILASLECCEVSKKILSRRDMMPGVYLFCFRAFDQFLDQEGYRVKRKNSIYDLTGTPGELPEMAKYRAIYQVLQYCEDALKSVWTLQIKNTRSKSHKEYEGNKSHELAMTGYIDSWLQFCATIGGSETSRDWFKSVKKAVEASKTGKGELTLIKPRSSGVHAIISLLEDAQEHIDCAEYGKADTLILKIQESIGKRSQRDSSLRCCVLASSYMRARILYYRAVMETNHEDRIPYVQGKQIVGQGWKVLEAEFHDADEIWDIAVVNERKKSRAVLPDEWMRPKRLFPI